MALPYPGLFIMFFTVLAICGSSQRKLALIPASHHVLPQSIASPPLSVPGQMEENGKAEETAGGSSSEKL